MKQQLVLLASQSAGPGPTWRHQAVKDATPRPWNRSIQLKESKTSANATNLQRLKTPSSMDIDGSTLVYIYIYIYLYNISARVLGALSLHRAAKAPKTPFQGHRNAVPGPTCRPRALKTPFQGQLGAQGPQKRRSRANLTPSDRAQRRSRANLAPFGPNRRSKAIRTFDSIEMIQNFCKCN